MKILLMTAPYISGTENLFPPLGILYLASSIRSKINNVEMKVVDGIKIGYQKTFNEVKKYNPDIIVLSSLTNNAQGCYQFIKDVKKELPKVFITLGGAHPTAMPEEAARSGADIVALGEGEETVVDIVRNYPNMKDILGTAIQNDGKVFIQLPRPLIMNLDSIPFPARDLIDLKSYNGWVFTKKNPNTQIFGSRGCPHNCNFCANPVWKHNKPWFRLRSPKNVMDEVEQLIDMGIREYFEECDDLNTSKQWAIDICKEKIKRGLDIPWKAQLRVDNIDDELANWMSKANLWYVQLGIENGNQRTLDGMGKGITIKQIENACKILKDNGITVMGMFIMFCVWEETNKLCYETEKETLNTINFSKSLFDRDLIDYVSISQEVPFPGSRLWGTAIKFNLIPEEYIGKWEHWNRSTKEEDLMRIPGVSQGNRVKIKNKGTQLQINTVMRSGGINLRTFNFLSGRVFEFAKRKFKWGE